MSYSKATIKHYLCLSTMGMSKRKSFTRGKVYSAIQGKEPRYMVFMNEFGEKHPIDKDKIGNYFREVHVVAPTEATLTMQLEWLVKTLNSTHRKQMTSTNPMFAVVSHKLANDANMIQSLIPVIKDLIKKEQEPLVEEEPVQVQIMSIEEYEGIMGQLDQLKHTGQLKQIGHTQVRAMITELYKRQAK